MRALIFTEGGSQIGLGHISRCSSLYDELESRGIEVEFIIYGDINDIDIIKDKNIKIVNWLSADYLKNYINKNDFCIVDSYLACEDLYKIFSNCAKRSLFIDDNGRIKYPNGIVVNPSLIPKAVSYPEKDTNCYLHGPKYVILRRPFIQNKREIISNRVKEIIITLGGSDLHNLTPLILKRFSKKYTDIIINVVIGPSFQNIEEIKKYNFENVIFHEDVTAEEMKNIMLKSDIAITAAGQTIYELMATKTPFIPIKVVENQSLNIEGLKKLNLIGVEIEYNSLLLNEKIVKEFERMRKFDIRKELSNEYEKIIDGLGSKRIIDALIQEDTVSNYLLRKVRKEDIRGTFQLSNEDYVREYSLNKEKISWNTHVNWFNRMLNSDNDVFYVVTDCSNKFLGQIRYKVENKTAIVSISLSKSIMNKGLSKGFLKQSLDLLTSERNYLDNIVAFVSDKNIASKRLFEKIHFVLDENQNGLLKYIYSINKVENNKC